jgi:uncharacterized membrane protein (UPF0127 family)
MAIPRRRRWPGDYGAGQRLGQTDTVRLDEIPPPEGLPPRLKQLLHRLDTDDGVRHLWWVLVAVLVLSMIVFIGRGGSRPADPSLQSGAGITGSALISQSAPSPRLPGFGEAALTVRAPGGDRNWCAAVAETEATRNQGLMARNDLAGYDAMVFAFPTQTDAKFYMRNTPLPLSIGWFTDTGVLLAQTNMEPCPDKPDCPTFVAPGQYRFAIEVPRGGFDRLGITSGAHITVGGACS